jgi:phytoene desaturase
MAAGSPFALAHTFGQTGPFRPANMVRGIDNAVLAGSSTVPGVGVPTTLISGRLAADRITGAATRAIAVLDTKAGLP